MLDMSESKSEDAEEETEVDLAEASEEDAEATEEAVILEEEEMVVEEVIPKEDHLKPIMVLFL